MSKKNRYKRTHQFTPYTKADGAAVSDEFDAIQAFLDLIPGLRDDGKGFADSPVIPDPTEPNHPVPYSMLTETEKSVNNARDEVLEKAQQVAKNTETVATNTQTAINQANSATQSATSAAESSRSADESEDWARKWASNPVDEAVSDDKYSAYHYATKAEQSARSLSTAADAAENSANIAAQKAEEAKTYSDKAASAAIGEIDYNKVRNVPRASTTQDGVTRLTSDTGLDSETLGLTAKAGKFLAQGIAALRLALNNYIPLNKRSSAVNSNSNENVATSAAVKTAYDKAVNAENLANTKWTAKPATETEAGILPISHKTDGTSKEKFASEYAVGEATKKGLQDKADRNHTHQTSDIVDFNSSVTGLIKNVVRKTYQQTKQHKKKIKIRVRKGPSYVYEDGEETINIQTEGTMTVYPNGKIEQIIVFRNFSPTWFGAETNDNALHIPVQLWSSMPNKVDYVTVFLNKTKSGAQYASEATEWILGWAEDIQEQIKDKVTIRAVRWTGGQDEPVDLIIKVEGY